jgi:Flp pilus assembly protein TadG
MHQAERIQRGRRSQVRSGATATEFAIVLPLLIVLCLTSVDFGRFAYAYIALGNAGRVGAECGATRNYSAASAATWQQLVEDAIREDFTAVAGLDPSHLLTQVDVAEDAYELNRITITVTYPFVTVVAWPTIPQPLEMRRTVMFRRFR